MPTEPAGSAGPGADVVELPTRIVGMAGEGQAATPAEYLAAGVPADLTNDSDTLVVLAAHHGRSGAVRVLLDAGAHPDAGRPSAVDAAVVSGRDDLAALCRSARPTT
jgi:hypothetical protein